MKPDKAEFTIPKNIKKKTIIFGGGLCLFFIILFGTIIYLFSQLNWQEEPTDTGIFINPVVTKEVINNVNAKPTTTQTVTLPTLKLSDSTVYLNYLQNQNLCKKEKIALTNIIKQFEDLQMQRDPSILAIFTAPDPSNQSEMDSYIYFSGTDIGNPRLYNTAETNYKEKSYTVKGNKEILVQTGSAKEYDNCTFVIEESRSFYKMPVNNNPPQWTDPKIYSTELWLTKEGDKWKVKYYSIPSGNEIPAKYSGFNIL